MTPSSLLDKHCSEAELRRIAFGNSLNNYARLMSADKLSDALIVLDAACGLAEGNDQGQMIELYVGFIFSASTKTRRTALYCGNILPEHLEQMQMALQASLHLQKIARGCQNGIAEILGRVLAQTARLGIKSCNEFLKRKQPGLTYAAELDEVLTHAAVLCEESGNLAPATLADREQYLQVARAALSNAIYCLPRFFPGADYAKAEVYCRHAAALLARQSNGQALDGKLPACVESIEKSAALLKAGKKKESRESMQAAYRLLQTVR